MLRIQRVCPDEHADEIYEFQERHFHKDPRVAAECAQWWFVFDGDEPVAFAGMSPSHRYRNCGYLCRAGVDEAYRGHGLQKRLIRVRLREARRIGWDYVYSDTTGIPASANALIACGFKSYAPANPYCFKETIYWRIRL